MSQLVRLRKHTAHCAHCAVENSKKNATNVTLHPFKYTTSRQFEETYENAQWRKAKQMHPVRFCILSGRQFEETFEKTLRRKVLTNIHKEFWTNIKSVGSV